MNTSSKKFRVTLRDHEDGSDDCFLLIPDAVMTELGWKIGDTLAYLAIAIKRPIGFTGNIDCWV